MSLENFAYYFEDHGVKKTLFLLHGTGGDEKDLLPLVQSLEEKYNFVGLRGNVDEQGMLRFFRRVAPGVFDQENIQEEAKKLADFLEAWFEKYDLTPDDVAFVGYSNGANMILVMTFLFPKLIKKAVLLHSMLPLVGCTADLSGKSFLVTYGHKDQMILAKDSQKVVEVLQGSGAEVEVVEHLGGHEIRSNEIEALETFLEQ
jgi:phospholipase/carboxylesterase